MTAIINPLTGRSYAVSSEDGGEATKGTADTSSNAADKSSKLKPWQFITLSATGVFLIFICLCGLKAIITDVKSGRNHSFSPSSKPLQQFSEDLPLPSYYDEESLKQGFFEKFFCRGRFRSHFCR